METPIRKNTKGLVTKGPNIQPSVDDNSSEGILSWIFPDASDKDDKGRTGLLSTHTEVHALILGITAGAHFGLSDDAQLLNDILGLTTASDRVRQAQYFPKKYRDQAKQELPYFVGGAAIGYGLSHTNALAELDVGR